MSLVGTAGQTYTNGVVSPTPFPFIQPNLYPADIPKNRCDVTGPSLDTLTATTSTRHTSDRDLNPNQVEELIQNVINQRSRTLSEKYSGPTDDSSQPMVTEGHTMDSGENIKFEQDVSDHAGSTSELTSPKITCQPRGQPRHQSAQEAINAGSQQNPLATSTSFKPQQYTRSGLGPPGSDYLPSPPSSQQLLKHKQGDDNSNPLQQVPNSGELFTKGLTKECNELYEADEANSGNESHASATVAPSIVQAQCGSDVDMQQRVKKEIDQQNASEGTGGNQVKGEPQGSRQFPQTLDGEESNDSACVPPANTSTNGNSSGEENYPEAIPIDGIYYCHLCSYSGTSKFHFNAHMNSHFEHQCPNCDYTSRTEGRLNRHIKDFHSQTPPENYSGTRMVRNQATPGRPKVYRCKQCEFVSTTKVEFWEHSRSHIKDDKILQCPKCPFVTEYKHHLEYHLRNHFGSKPFKCSKCNYSCVNKSMLNSHMKSHTNVYQYRCADCTYATKYCHSLKLHLRKYNHKPATILNLDGSVDAETGLEFPPRRGPPRGPRGPRKEKPNEETPNPLLLNPALMALHGFGGPRPGLINPYWPMMTQVPGMPGLQPQSMMPIPGMANVVNPNLLPQPPKDSQASSSPIEDKNQEHGGLLKCNLCPFTTESRETFSQHILKVHAAENQDLFSMFGISSDALADDNGRRTSPQKGQGHAVSPTGNQQLHVQTDGSSANNRSSPRSWPNGVHVTGVQQGQPSSHSLPDLNRSESQHPSDLVIDLSRPNSHDSGESSNQSGSSMEQAEKREIPLDLSHAMVPESVKRGINDNRNESLPVKKRSRKGKAYRLDTLCLKLQGDGSEPPSEDYSDYSPEQYENKLGGPSPPTGEQARTGTDQQPPQNVNDRSNLQLVRQCLIQGNLDGKKVVSPGKKEPSSSSPVFAEQAVKDAYTHSLQLRAHQMQEQMLRHPATSMVGLSNGHLAQQEMMFLMNARSQNQSGGQQAAWPSSNYECQYCDIAFRDCVMYTMHMGYHGYQNPFKCNMCGHEATDKVDFFLHIARVAHA